MVTYQGAFSGRKVCITGGLGFIGSNLAIRLVELGADVLLVDSLVPAYGGNLFNIEPVKDRVRVNIADVRDVNGMDYLVQGNDYLFNLAGQISHIDSMRDPYTDLEINCRAQLSILEACRHHNPGIKIVYAGTRQVYGAPEYLPVDEKHLLRPVDVNGINKMAGEWYHILYNNVYGIRAVSLRLTNTYGPRLLMKHGRQGFSAWFIRQAIHNQEIQLFGDGRQLRDLNYVNDVVEAMLLAAVYDGANGGSPAKSAAAGDGGTSTGCSSTSHTAAVPSTSSTPPEARGAVAGTRGAAAEPQGGGATIRDGVPTPLTPRDGVPIFNLGNSPPVSLAEFVRTLLEVCQEFGLGKGGYRLVPFPAEKKRIDIGDYYADYSKIHKTLGWQPAVDLREGLRRTVAFYVKYGEHYWGEE